MDICSHCWGALCAARRARDTFIIVLQCAKLKFLKLRPRVKNVPELVEQRNLIISVVAHFRTSTWFVWVYVGLFRRLGLKRFLSFY